MWATGYATPEMVRKLTWFRNLICEMVPWYLSVLSCILQESHYVGFI